MNVLSNPQALHRLLPSAIEKAKQNGSTVFEQLMHLMPEHAAEAVAQWVHQGAGVAVALSPRFRPVVGHPQHLQLQELDALALYDAQQPKMLCIGLPNPWDERRCRQLQGLLGSKPEFVALPHSSAKPVNQPMATESPVVDFVDAALSAAYEQGASDVHFESHREGLRVKLRLDGVLVEHGVLPGTERASEAISRIKVLSSLDITEQRIPQDGRLRFITTASAAVDIRVSVMPSIFGEDAVLRLLDKAQLRKANDSMSLEVLGFDSIALATLRDLVALPHGMLLVTGPTGSGKTTTVYATLTEVNTGLEKIITIEDPVEYELSGVLQVPVNEKKGLTFATGLRSILRHDPDRILVGEIRDAETAEIAVQSALTGHQVFTTVHANSILDVTGRFKHFGLDMFGFMSALNGVVVQRLLRKACAHCQSEREVSAAEATWLRNLAGEAPTRTLTCSGCSHCRGTGYSGRLVLAEVHVVTDTLRDLITEGAPLSQVKAHISSSGVVPLARRGAQLVHQHLTTLEEVRRVVGWA
jgi:general secretion pathway protein E